jgi:hypothetical protein
VTELALVKSISRITIFAENNQSVSKNQCVRASNSNKSKRAWEKSKQAWENSRLVQNGGSLGNLYMSRFLHLENPEEYFELAGYRVCNTTPRYTILIKNTICHKFSSNS